MSVTISLQLPDQPVLGAVSTTPLGGNGFISPHSLTHAKVTSNGDAGGGFNRIYIRFDPRYVQLPADIQVTIAGTAANEPLELDLQERSGYSMGIVAEVNSDVAISGLVARFLWSPPPLLMVANANADVTAFPVLRVTAPNVDGDNLSVLLAVYNFDRQARERVPLDLMSRVLNRGTNTN